MRRGVPSVGAQNIVAAFGPTMPADMIPVTSIVAYSPTAPVSGVFTVGNVWPGPVSKKAFGCERSAGASGWVNEARPWGSTLTSFNTELLGTVTWRFASEIVLPVVAHVGVSREQVKSLVQGGCVIWPEVQVNSAVTVVVSGVPWHALSATAQTPAPSSIFRRPMSSPRRSRIEWVAVRTDTTPREVCWRVGG